MERQTDKCSEKKTTKRKLLGGTTCTRLENIYSGSPLVGYILRHSLSSSGYLKPQIIPNTTYAMFFLYIHSYHKV